MKPKDSRNSGGASPHAPPPLVARGFTRRLKKGSGGAPPFFLASDDCYLYLQQETQKKGPKQLILDLSFFVF